jgi:diguanylate cyclase (GGDEF)-like protein
MTAEGRAPSAERRVWHLTAVMALVAAALAAPAMVSDPSALSPSPLLWVLLPSFALAEVVVIHLPAQRSSHSHTLREIPAIVGLTFLAPQQYVLAYVIGGGLALLLWSRLKGLKLAFNVAMFALEATVGALVYHLLLGGADPISPHAWLAALAAVLVTDLVSAAAVTAAISLTEGGFDDHVLREALRSGVVAAVVNACVALLVVTLLVVRPSALPLLGVVVVLLVLGYRLYISLAREHAQMRLLYRFVGSTGRSAELGEVVSAVLSESAHLLHASHSRLVTLPSGDSPGRSWTWAEGALSADVAGAADPRRRWWEGALRGEPVLLTAQEGGMRRIDLALPRDGVAVPLVNEGEVGGVLMVFDRSFTEETFSTTDQGVLETMAAHASVALDKARAVERLHVVAEERAHDALHDQLTAMPNRRALLGAIEDAMSEGRRGVVLLLDLDDFKDVNDTLGHTAGDQLLMVTGRRLAEEASGMVARLGGDEFAVLLTDTDVTTAHGLALRLQSVVHQPVPLGDAEIVTTTSVGVATLDGCTTAEEVLGCADIALYAAKGARTGIEEYRAADRDATARRLTLAADLPAALREGALELWYQPQAMARTGQITGFEALLRWTHPRFGPVPPPEVVAVAQRTGLMPALTSYVLDHALHDRRSWWLAGHDLDVSVNITPRDLSDESLVSRVDAILTETGTPPGVLVLELTESDALGDPERSVSVLNELASRGVRLSVDDFGTGYSSLAYLDQLPVHEVKIDQSFVFRLEKAEDATIVRATVALAHDLGLRVVAEGVESDLTRTLVTGLGCDLFQGYGLARPMPGREVLGWLARRASYTKGVLDPHTFGSQPQK